MDQNTFACQMVQYQRIEENMVTEVYINCFGSEDAFFANHLANLLQNVVDGKIQHPIIAQYNTQLTEKCGNEITKWLPSTVVPPNAELRQLKKIKILDTLEGYEDESSIYVVCAAQRASSEPKFTNVSDPIMLLIANVEAIITTANVPRDIYLKDKKYTLIGATSHKPNHFIGMMACNKHKQHAIIDDLFKTTKGCHSISRAFYLLSK
ncbi:unnamed protein product [Rotaria sordida]|uniref:Uncharacterized protein n=1 Tax=Rotaria sordida TaxID=392033 RepID=A0A819FZG7_9BILA|nr:unnamed protein product [Rotaria sordida]CAF3877137.1 unnamed protein product [Rotaria sordida]